MSKKYTKYDNIYDDNEKIYNDGEIYTVDKEHNKSDDPKYKNFTITIVQPNDAVIEVVTKGKETVVHTTTFSAPYDTRYTVRFKDNKNPSGLYLNCTNNGKLARDITIKAFTPEDKDKQVLMTIMQTDNQTIVAYGITKNAEGKWVYSGENYTESFFAYIGSKWRFAVIPNKDIGDYYLNIIQFDHQTITVRAMTGYHDYRAGVLVSYPHDDKLAPYTENDNDKYEYTATFQNCRIFSTLAFDNEDLGTINHRLEIRHVPYLNITVTDMYGRIYTKSCYMREGMAYTAKVTSADRHYLASKVIINGVVQSGNEANDVLNTDTIITALPAVPISTYIKFTPQVFDTSIQSRLNYDTILHMAVGDTKESLTPLDIYNYKKIRINTNPAKFGADDIKTNDLYTSRLSGDHTGDTVYPIKFSPTKEYSTGETYAVKPRIYHWYDKEYHAGYMLEMQNKISNRDIRIYGTDDTVKLRLMTYSFDADSDINDGKLDITEDTIGRWMIGLDDVTNNGNDPTDLINEIIIYFYDDLGHRIIGKIGNFNYYSTFAVYNDDKTNCPLYTKKTLHGPTDSMYINLLQHINKPMIVRIGLYK